MNYVGSVSIIDRGDAPAKAIIDKNTRSLAQRVADETKEELDKVMDRVDNIYVSYEMSTQTMFENPRASPNVEYIEDIKELEGILNDTVKKKKYQQQVTVFVVGFQDVSAQKMQLLSQVNQFFLENSKPDEDELTEEKPDIDLEEASNKVHETLNTAGELAKRLSDLNQDIIEWLVNYANTKASNKGKKRLEKSLDAAKTELTDLAEKLLKLQTELEEKDEKFQQVAKQLEAKTQEAIRYKTAAEVAKKSAQDNENHTSMLHEEIQRRDEKINELRTKLSRLEINLTETQFDKELVTRRADKSTAATKEKLAQLQDEVDTKRMAISDAEREMEKLHKEQLICLQKEHHTEIEELKQEHQEELVKLTDELDSLQGQLATSEKFAQETIEQSDELKTKIIELQLRTPTKENLLTTTGTSNDLAGKSIADLSSTEDDQPRQSPLGPITIIPPKSESKENTAPVKIVDLQHPGYGITELMKSRSAQKQAPLPSIPIIKHEEQFLLRPYSPPMLSVGDSRRSSLDSRMSTGTRRPSVHKLPDTTPKAILEVVRRKSATTPAVKPLYSTQQESRPSTKDTKSSKKSESLKPSRAQGTRSPNRLGGREKQGRREQADASVQDDGGDPSKAYVEKSTDPSRQPTRQSKNLDTVIEGDGTEFTSAFDLDDDDSWASVPGPHLPGRFLQFRQLSRVKVKDLEDQLNVTLTKTHRKVNSLKSQFNEHKGKWEAERKILIEQVEQAQKLQTDAEKEADAAMTQLEEFINEQEKLEDEEEAKRQEIIKTMSRPGTVKRGSPPAEKPSTPDEKGEERGQGERIHSENSEQELKNLMQQTDDAKSRTASTASHLDGTPLAPWLDSHDNLERKTLGRHSDDHNDLNSRLTQLADAEIQNIRDGPETNLSSLNIQEFPKVKGEVHQKPIDGLKGERERLLSRTSSMASMRRRLRSKSHLSERDEEEEEDSDGDDLAPWITPAGKIKEKKRLMSRGSRSRTASRLSKTSHDDDGLGELQDILKKKDRSGRATGEIEDVSEVSTTDRDSSLERKLGSSLGKDGRNSKSKSRGGKKTKKLGREMKVPRIRLSLRRPSSAKIPKELQERLEKIMEKERRARSSQGHRPAKEVHGFTDSESDWDMKKHAIKTFINPKKIIKSKKGKDRLKLPQINFNLRKRRTSSAKVPKELQEKLAVEMEKNRKTRSSLGHIPKDEHPMVSETDGDATNLKPLVTDEEKVKAQDKLADETVRPLSSRRQKQSEPKLFEIINDDDDEKAQEMKVHVSSRQDLMNENKETIDTIQVAEKVNVEDDGKSRMSKSTIRRSSLGKRTADDTAFEDDGDMQSPVDTARGDAVNRLTETGDITDRSDRRELDVDSAIEDDVLEPMEIKLESVMESARAKDVEKAMFQSNDMESQATLHLQSRLTQQSLKSVSLADEMDLQDIGDIQDEGGIHIEGKIKKEIGDQSKISEQRGNLKSGNGKIKVEDRHTDRRKMDEADIDRRYQDGSKAKRDGEIETVGREGKSSYGMTDEEKVESSRPQVSLKGEIKSTADRRPESSSKRGQTASVNVLQAVKGHEQDGAVLDIEGDFRRISSAPEIKVQEKTRQVGAISAPPAVQPDDPKQQKLQTPREDNESAPVTPRPRTMSGKRPVINLDQQKPASTPKQAFATPRPDNPFQQRPDSASEQAFVTPRPDNPFQQRSDSASEQAFVTPRPDNPLQQMPDSSLEQALVTPRPDNPFQQRPDSAASSSSTMTFINESEFDEGVAMEINPSQSEALDNLKSMMAEESLTVQQQKTLESLRSAIRTLSSEQKLRDIQLERTVTILSLASQIARESVELGVLPDTVFDGFSKMDSGAISALSGQRSLKGSAVSRSRQVGKSMELDSNIPEVDNLEIEAVPEIEFNLVKERTSKSSKPKRSSKSHKGLDKDDVHPSKSVKRLEKEEANLKASKSKDAPKETAVKKGLNVPVSGKDLKNLSREVNHNDSRRSSVSSPFSGGSNSNAAGFLSSRGETFSASIPRSLTSSERRKHSPHDPNSPTAGKTRPKSKNSHSTELPPIRSEKSISIQRAASGSSDTMSDHIRTDIRGHETKTSTISIVFSPTKKSRHSVTMDDMLYGEKTLHTVEVTDMELKLKKEVLEVDNDANDLNHYLDVDKHEKKRAESIAKMRKRSLKLTFPKLLTKISERSNSVNSHFNTKVQSQLPDLNDQVSSHVDDNLSLLSLQNNPSTVSLSDIDLENETKSGQNDVNKIETEDQGQAQSFDQNLTELPEINKVAKITKFQCVSKVLTFEIKTERKHRKHDRPTVIKSFVEPVQANFSPALENSGNFHNLDKFELTGSSVKYKNKPVDSGKLESTTLEKQYSHSKSQSFSGFVKQRSRSYLNSDSSVTGKPLLSNKKSLSKLLSNRNSYEVSRSEFGKKAFFSLDESILGHHADEMQVDKVDGIDIVATLDNEESVTDNVSGKDEENGMVAKATQWSPSCFESTIELDPNLSIGHASSQESSFLRETTEVKTPKSPKSLSKSPQPLKSRETTFTESHGNNKKHSATSKRSLPHSQMSVQSDIFVPPKSPSTQGRTSINRTPRTSATPGTLVSEIQRPLSLSSVQPRICQTPPSLHTESPPPDLHMHNVEFDAPPPHLHMETKETQTDELWSPSEHEPITGHSDDDVRISSAKSRASLRNQFKNKLDETRLAAESRRTKSPVIAVPAQKSIDDELIIEDDDDDDLPIPDDAKEEALHKEDTIDAGTSPPLTKEASRKISVASRKSTNLAEHPVVAEYLRAYTGIHKFKEAMSNVLVDKDQMSASQLLTDLEALTFDKDNKVVPQISNMTENIYYVLNEVSQVINSVLQNDRGPVVSSLMTRMSRDDTQRSMFREKSGITEAVPITRQTQRTVSTRDGSASTDRQQFSELQASYEKLQNQMSVDSHKYEEQHQRNMVAMMEMQDTINSLQRELSALGKQTRRPPSESVSTAGPVQQTESAIMFTRLDSERNAKIMKKAVNDEKLDPSKYKEAVVQMDEYVSLPAQRLAHLVRKYVHHCRMKQIEDNVQQSQSLNQNVFEILDKMEALQSQRAKRWNDRMDEMGTERYRLANMLMETLDSIEQESGIFLIKPMYSYRGREPKDRFGGKISRPFRPHRTLSPLRDTNSAYAPAPTPASTNRPPRLQRRQEPDQYPADVGQSQGRYEPPQPLDGNSTGLLGSSVTYTGAVPQATWSMSDSQIGGSHFMSGNVNTPRILEIDINRMMIGQNTISAQIGMQGLSHDRLVNASNNNLRSYMTVNRPGPGSAGKSDRPKSGSRQRDSPILSTSPTNLSSSQKRVRMSDMDVPSVMTASQPLPPIGGNMSYDHPKSGSSKGKTSPHRVPVGSEIPDSPPGSSLRHSPPIEEQ